MLKFFDAGPDPGSGIFLNLNPEWKNSDCFKQIYFSGSGTGLFPNDQHGSCSIPKQQNPETYSTTKPPVRANPCGKSFADPGCLFRIPDPNFSIPDPGSTLKNLSTLTPKNSF
jgi:hypothetical protein